MKDWSTGLEGILTTQPSQLYKVVSQFSNSPIYQYRFWMQLCPMKSRKCSNKKPKLTNLEECLKVLTYKTTHGCNSTKTKPSNIPGGKIFKLFLQNLSYAISFATKLIKLKNIQNYQNSAKFYFRFLTHKLQIK